MKNPIIIGVRGAGRKEFAHIAHKLMMESGIVIVTAQDETGDLHKSWLKEEMLKEHSIPFHVRSLDMIPMIEPTSPTHDKFENFSKKRKKPSGTQYHLKHKYHK